MFSHLYEKIFLFNFFEIKSFYCCYIHTGGVIKDQATADEDASMKERLAIGVGSVAGGIKDSSDDPLVHDLAKTVEKGAGEVAEQCADSSSSSSSEE